MGDTSYSAKRPRDGASILDESNSVMGVVRFGCMID